MNIIEKILARASGRKSVAPGNYSFGEHRIHCHLFTKTMG